MAPKSLLRHPSARSPIEDFLPDTKFQRVIRENGEASKYPDRVSRLIFCTGYFLNFKPIIFQFVSIQN